MSPTESKVVASVSREFYDRRHPMYGELLEQWTFFWSSYKGGRAWFKDNVFRYHKEGEKEFQERLKRSYRFNHTREVVDILQKYLFKAPVARNTENAPEALRNFWKRATRGGMNIDQFARSAATRNSVAGRVAVVVDNNIKASTTENGKISEADVKGLDLRIYAYYVMPWDILDYAWDEDGDGELLWIKLREWVRNDTDPFTSNGLTEERVRLWTRSEWILYAEKKVQSSGGVQTDSKEPAEIVEVAKGEHGLGFVPVKLFDHILGGDAYEAPGLIEDIAYLDRAVANYLSNLDAIIQDQTFSQLAIPAQSLNSGDDSYEKILEMGTKRIFTFDGGAGSTAKPEFISPDPKQAAVIVTVINKIINEIYQTVGLAGERTKEDNAVGIDNSSGVAKAYDFERVNSLLLAKAQSCEHMENWIVKVVLAWAGEKMPANVERLVTYPTTFDVARLGDELATAESLQKLDAPMEIRSAQFEAVIDKIFPQISADLREKLRASLKSWKSATEIAQERFDAQQATAQAVAAAKTGNSSSSDRTVAGSRQGEVTSKTKDAGK